MSAVDQTNFGREKELQELVESNLELVFGCRFIATEFPTGEVHAGRIDTLALSEESNPVIIEYKKKESSNLINQSLFYLAWIKDHRGDFQVEAQKALGDEVQVDWSDIRVICIAPDYKKYDLHAVQVMGTNLELWTYRLFTNNSLYLEKKALQESTATSSSNDFKELTAGQKAALSRKTGSYTVEEHFENKPADMQDLARAIEEFVVGLDSAIEEVPKKFYIAYKLSKNFICMRIQRGKIKINAGLDPKKVDVPKQLNSKDATGDHYGTCNLELSIKNLKDLELAKPLLERAYQKTGG